jgi:hypothetical protein
MKIEKAEIFAKLKQAEMARFNFYLPKELYETFKKECEVNGVTMSAVITEFMTAFLVNEASGSETPHSKLQKAVKRK